MCKAQANPLRVHAPALSQAELPSAFLTADAQLHSHVVVNIRILLDKLQTELGLTPAANIGLKLKKSGLPNAALWGAKDLADDKAVPLRVDTVHQAKGESLDAVLYMTLKYNAQELLTGVGTEVGRIGYVASTRVRYLLWAAAHRPACRPAPSARQKAAQRRPYRPPWAVPAGRPIQKTNVQRCTNENEVTFRSTSCFKPRSTWSATQLHRMP